MEAPGLTEIWANNSNPEPVNLMFDRASAMKLQVSGMNVDQ
jgi:hypothetical protein